MISSWQPLDDDDDGAPSQARMPTACQSACGSRDLRVCIPATSQKAPSTSRIGREAKPKLLLSNSSQTKRSIVCVCSSCLHCTENMHEFAIHTHAYIAKPKLSSQTQTMTIYALVKEKTVDRSGAPKGFDSSSSSVWEVKNGHGAPAPKQSNLLCYICCQVCGLLLWIKQFNTYWWSHEGVKFSPSPPYSRAII